MAMQLKLTIEEYKQLPEMQYGPYFYLAPPDEMKARAKSIKCEEAYDNTNLVAEKCNVEITLGKYQVPVFKIEEMEDYKEFLQWKTTQL
jgi:DNA polymerase III alpha subunit